MPDNERLQNPHIEAREAVSRIAKGIVKQRGVKGEIDRLNKLEPAMLSVLDAFGVGNTPVEKTIFTASDLKVSEALPGLPEIYVHEASGTISVDKRIKKFRTGRTKGNGIYWYMLLYFMSNANTNIDASTLREIALNLGIKSDIRNCIAWLRKRIEDNPGNPKIITTVGHGHADNTAYRLNAVVHIANKPLSSKKENIVGAVKTMPLPPAVEITATETPKTTESNLVDLLAIKPTEKEKNPPNVVIIDSIDQLPEEVRKEVDFLLKSGEEGKALLKILSITLEKKPITGKLLFNMIYGKDVSGGLDKADKHRLYGLIGSKKKEIKAKDLTIISKTMKIKDKGKELKELVFWLASIRDYSRARNEIKATYVLTLAILRTASEENPLSHRLLAKEVFGEVTDNSKMKIRTRLVYLRNALEKSGEVIKSVPLKKEQGIYGSPQLGYWIAKKDSQVLEDSTPPVKQETIFVKEDPPKETNFPKESLDKPPVLAIAQIAALAIIFQGPMYEEVLKQHGIIIIKNELRLKAVKDIVVKCRRLMGGGEFTEIFLRESFPALAQYLKEFAGGDREAFIRSNNDRAQTLLKMIPAKITVDKLGLLMDEIGKIINR